MVRSTSAVVKQKGVSVREMMRTERMKETEPSVNDVWTRMHVQWVQCSGVSRGARKMQGTKQRKYERVSAEET